MVRPRDIPDRARVVIIGGGVGGTSIAYHLAELGERDVVLLDRNELTSGSTFHSAGLVGQLRGSALLHAGTTTYSVELYRRLAGESEFDPGWVECGGIRLACTPEREQETKRQVAWAKTFGLPLGAVPFRGPGAVPPDGHRGRAHRVVPAHRRLPRPLPAHLCAGRRRPPRRCASSPTRASRGSTCPTAACGGVSTEWGDIEAEYCRQRRWHVRRRDRPPGRGARADRPVRPRVPRDAAVRGDGGVCAAGTGRARSAISRRCATPTCSSTTARRATAW